MKLEADRMANLVITPKEFAKEIKVVMEERRLRTDDQPQSLVYETLMAAAYQAHPYRRPIIGWMNDLENMTAQDARDWYRRWYAPNNATLVVVGDVKPEEVLELAKRYFGKIRPAALPQRKPQAEPDAARHQAHRREGAGQAALSCDGLPRAHPARSGEGPGALCAGGAGGRAGRQRLGATQSVAGREQQIAVRPARATT